MPCPNLPAATAARRRALYSVQLLSFSGSRRPPGHVHSRLMGVRERQTKHRFAATGMPSCLKRHEIPLTHLPSLQAVQGLAQVLAVLDTRPVLDAVGAWEAGGGGRRGPVVPAAVLAAAAPFPVSLNDIRSARRL